MDDRPLNTRPRPRRAPGGAPGAAVRLLLLALLVAGSFVAARAYGLPGPVALREAVAGTGATGAVVFVAGYAVLALLPSPKAVLTALAGALFGWGWGAALSLAGALLGAAVAYEIGRLLGRDGVRRLTRGRSARAEEVLADHGLGAVTAVRLVPVVPFTAINYAAALAGVGRRDYLLGSAVGMVPGSLAYAAFGAWGAEPWAVLAAVSALLVPLLVLVVGGGWWGRRLLPPRLVAADGPEVTDGA